MHWAYGLVEVKGKHGGELQLCEVYFEKKKPFDYCHVDWKDFRKDKKAILGDIVSQAKVGFEFYDDGKKLTLKKRKKPVYFARQQ